jgi:hypothetical protein
MAGVDMGVALPETYLQEVEEEAQRNMEAALARVTAAGLTGERVVLYGVPFQEIVETAKARQVDLIVMGTHGRRGAAHLLMGSVAERVVRIAPCPVLTLRHPERELVMPDALMTLTKLSQPGECSVRGGSSLMDPRPSRGCTANSTRSSTFTPFKHG